MRALVACPTGSIRLAQGVREPLVRDAARSTFPLPVHALLVPNVYYLGYHSEASFGATPYLLAVPAGNTMQMNVMIDSPRFNSKLADRIEALGGLQMLLLTHMDDVADHNRWKARFPGLVRVMHHSDVRGPDEWPHIDMRGVERQLRGEGPWELAPGITAVHTPGHSYGSICFLAAASIVGSDEGVLFTGDHLAFAGSLGRLDGFARYGNDVHLQAASIAKLADLPFSWVLPGHGRRWHFASAAERHSGILQCAREFAADPDGRSAPGPVWYTR